MNYRHPFLNVEGTIDTYQLEGGRQAHVSWARSQSAHTPAVGEICRANGHVGVFLGRENGNDYYMHIMGSDVPDDAVGLDLDSTEFIMRSLEDDPVPVDSAVQAWMSPHRITV